MRRHAAVWFVLGLLPLSAPAMTFMDEQIVCPIDGKPFSARLAASGTSFGRYFDGQEYGPIASPWPLPVCPGNGFVVDEKRSYSEPELARLRAFVDTPEYRGWAAKDTPYYRLAKQRAFFGDSEDKLAQLLLVATWEAGAQRYPRYAEEALAAWRKRAAREGGGEAGHEARLLIGELQRRLGRFDEARATFEALRADRGFPGAKLDAKDAEYLRKIVAAQLQLIRDRSVAHARLDENGEIVDF
ncbi:hypothetical protein J5226_02750 [Lysobacter sp. K5869]|uniref:hypothetical protein n=1 Tax=Lysobacter sp. K5869 TaxID=2820808 RepID=UPI001C062262|nr:hypothetical protein [Lysobacter sp. K5869]QWP77342.1 hypothetical protein J5226_02750 [Lysobacter sp. K5869]